MSGQPRRGPPPPESRRDFRGDLPQCEVTRRHKTTPGRWPEVGRSPDVAPGDGRFPAKERRLGAVDQRTYVGWTARTSTWSGAINRSPSCIATPVQREGGGTWVPQHHRPMSTPGGAAIPCPGRRRTQGRRPGPVRPRAVQRMWLRTRPDPSARRTCAPALSRHATRRAGWAPPWWDWPSWRSCIRSSPTRAGNGTWWPSGSPPNPSSAAWPRPSSSR